MKTPNTTYHNATVTRERRNQLNKHKSVENIRRIGEAAKLMVEAGVIAITAFISPFRIYCKASLEVCESRDVKGLYKRARTGGIKNYTGIDSPYEEPNSPELVIDTESETLEESIDKIINFLKSKELLVNHT